VDTVMDFEQGSDKVDFAKLFAGTLTFRGTQAFTGKAGEVNYDIAVGLDGSATSFVRVDLTGNGLADLAVNFAGFIGFQASDFHL
jgi:hypothetical protein